MLFSESHDGCSSSSFHALFSPFGQVPGATEHYSEPLCCICYEAAPSVPSMLCGHKALCAACATVVESGTRQCPLCRERFVRKIEVFSL